MKNTKKGFTLVELLVVIAILAILASVAVVGYTAFLTKANQSKAQSELHQIVTYIDAELMDDGKWTTGAVTVVRNSADGTLTITGLADGKTLADAIKADAAFAELFAGENPPSISYDPATKTLTYVVGEVSVTGVLR